MKKFLALVFAAAIVVISCNDSGSKSDDTLNQHRVDSASDMPAPTTLDTSTLTTDTPNVEKALRK
jgi:hypothetical protein